MELTQFRGRFTPVRNYVQAVPVWGEKSYTWGKKNVTLADGRKREVSSTISLKVYRPTDRFPTIGINVKMSSGVGEVFAQFSPETFLGLLDFLNNNWKEIEALLPNLILLQQQVQDQIQKMNEYKQILEVARMAQQPVIDEPQEE